MYFLSMVLSLHYRKGGKVSEHENKGVKILCMHAPLENLRILDSLRVLLQCILRHGFDTSSEQIFETLVAIFSLMRVHSDT